MMRSLLPGWAQLALMAYALVLTWRYAADSPARGHVFERERECARSPSPPAGAVSAACPACPTGAAAAGAEERPQCVCPACAPCPAPVLPKCPAASAAPAPAAVVVSGPAGAASAAASCPVCAVSREPSFALTEHIQGHWRRGHTHMAKMQTQPSFAHVHELVYGTKANVYAHFKNWANKSRPSDYSHTHLHSALLDRLLGTGPGQVVPRFVVEVGSMHGGSAQVFGAWLHAHGYGPVSGASGSANPNAVTVLCIDTWLGDLNMWLKNIAWDHLAVHNGRPTTFEQFMWNIADTPYTTTIVPFPVTSLLGARFLHTVYLAPNVVYLDSAHEIDETYQELCLYWFLLPGGGVLFGDDYHWEGVGADVRKFVAKRQRNHPALKLDVEQSSNTWILHKPESCPPHSMC